MPAAPEPIVFFNRRTGQLETERIYGEGWLRWIYVHMMEESARHNGHADLLRELIDGAVGD